MQKPIHIEFIGISASGKSSVSDALFDILKNRKVDIVAPNTRELVKLGKFKKYLYPTAYIFKKINFVKGLFYILLYFFLILPTSKNEFKNYYLLIISYIFKNYCVNTKRNEVFIFGGESCIIFNLPINRLSSNLLKLLISRIYIHNALFLLVFINTPADIAIKRAHSDHKIEPKFRPEAFMGDLRKQQLIYEKNIEKQKSFMNLLKRHRKEFLVKEIDGTKSPEENANYLSEIIKKVLGS